MEGIQSFPISLCESPRLGAIGIIDNMHGVYSEFRGNTELALTPNTVQSFHCASHKSNAPNVFRSGVAGTRLYTGQVCELLYWINSVTIHYYWRRRPSRTKILELCLAWRPTLGSFFIHCCESGAEAFLLVNKQSDVVSIVNVLESELANLDEDLTTEAIHNIVHRSAKQSGSRDTSLP